jgi:hypothetical protein
MGGVAMLAIVAPAVSLGASALSGRALFALVPLFVLLGVLIVYCLVDLIRAPSVRYLPKPVWALIIVVVSAPLGALAYLVFGKDRHGHNINGHDVNEPAGHVAARW